MCMQNKLGEGINQLYEKAIEAIMQGFSTLCGKL